MTTLKFTKGNVLNQAFNTQTLLIHCCNIYNGFGSGVAGAIARKFPHVKAEYHNWYDSTMHECEIMDESVPFNLGKVQWVDVHLNLKIGNMLGQSYPGGQDFKIGDKKIHLRPVRLDSIRECLYNVAVVAKKLDAQVVGPKFASGLAGGDWKTEVEPLVEECLLKFDIPVTIYDLE